MARRRKVGFAWSDYQLEDFFVCVETDDSLEMRDLSQGPTSFSMYIQARMGFGNQDICDWPLMTRSWPTCRALSPRLRARSSRETSFASKVTRIYPRRIPRLCPQLRTLMLEVPLGSSAWPLPRHVSALRVFSSLWGVEDALMVIVSAMESTKMATAQVGSMWLKRLIVPHG